jgi:fructose/tagatose bisphosphate aldolase
MEKLVEALMFAQDKEAPERKIKKLAKKSGLFPVSSQRLYRMFSQEELKGFTIPAINIRTLTFDTAQAVFRAAKKEAAGPFIFEIARSEIGYTSQLPDEYLNLILAGAIKEKFQGPVFFQADHCKVNPKGYEKSKEREREKLERLIKEAFQAGFYNFDIDGSNLKNIQDNAELTASITQFIRGLKIKEDVISLGGEVGEIGGRDTSLEEVKEYLESYRDSLRKLKLKPEEGIIKLAVQAKTAHGGRVLPSGELEKVDEDFPHLKRLSQKARDYGLAGIVQHGASTLSRKYFSSFPEAGVIEIHLATGFQNIVYGSEYFPVNLKDSIYRWLSDNFSQERKQYQTDAQFFYKTRKKALGPFKKEIYNIPQENKDKIAEELEEEFRFFFRELNISGKKTLLAEIYSQQ